MMLASQEREDHAIVVNDVLHLTNHIVLWCSLTIVHLIAITGWTRSYAHISNRMSAGVIYSKDMAAVLTVLGVARIMHNELINTSNAYCGEYKPVFHVTDEIPCVCEMIRDTSRDHVMPNVGIPSVSTCTVPHDNYMTLLVKSNIVSPR